MNISLNGLYTPGGSEDRSIAYLKIEYNGNMYDWIVYLPSDIGMELSEYIEYIKTSIQSDIDAKEAIWSALDPKTETIDDPFGGTPTVRDIDKSEIVKPEIPDYYAKRRAEYPPMNEQLGAIGKGVDSDEYKAILQKIEEVKAKYPKPVDTIKPVANTTHNVVWSSQSLDWLYQEKTAEEVLAEKVQYWNGLKLNRIQFEFMVEKLGLTTVIDGAIAAMPETNEAEANAKIMARVLFKSGQEFFRLHPLFTQLAPLVGLTEEQLDQIWLNARTI
jgi:hypothetical protein